MIQDFVKSETDKLCETFEELKIIPRSYKHLKSILKSMNNHDDSIEVYTKGGILEEADISDEEYIELASDSCKFYYSDTKKKNQHSVKELKVKIIKYCYNNCEVNYKGLRYCEDCFKKIPNVPRIRSIVSLEELRLIT